MKFLCDRCKTRYSIGDDRVRGKILKIRCKNCQNVITVREGMTDEGGIDPGPAAERRTRPTTGGGHAANPAPARGALGAAFQSQLTKPPPALEEEWYVSIDGVQTGPLALPAAQKWVAAKPFDADLHCWSEGFDDWLPVDKVSHFRGLRKAPPPRPTGKTVPPPIPKREDEPKPLFASTMASLEKSASASLPAIAPAPTMKGPGVAAVQARANGMGGASPMTGKGTAPNPSMPVPSIPAMPNRGATPKSAGAAALAQAFDTENINDAKTSIGAPAFKDPPFKDEVPTTADPFAARRAEHDDPFFPKAKTPEPKQPTSKPDPNAFGPAPKVGAVPVFNDEDDGLEIGEVSRVVKLADLAPRPQKVATAGFEKLGATGSVPRIGGMTGPTQRVGGLTGSSPKLSPSELGMNVDPSLAALSPTGEPASDESVVAKSFRQRHRRSLYTLIGIAVVMVAGVVALFMFVVNNNNDDLGPGLGGIRSIDTSRPEDIVRKQLPPPPNATGSATGATRHWTGRTGNGGNNIITQNPQDEIANGKTLQASEVEDMAAKQGEGTKRCYMRAQKGALGFEIADVKKIAVTLIVAKDGTVSDVQLSDHAKDTFGQCLIARIKGWKFRESSGGTFRISLAFSNT